MPATSQAVDPQGNTILFDEAEHRYHTPSPVPDEIPDILYTSGTSLIHKFGSPFDQRAIAERVAARDGRNVDEVIAEWKAKADASCLVGTRVHEVCEDVLLNRAIRNTPADERERALMHAGYDAAVKVRTSMQLIGVEKIVFDIDLRIAGTIDLLAKAADGSTWILDWKTNQKMRDTNEYGQFMLAPVSHLPSCEVSTYSLQLSLYELILRRRGYIPPNTRVNRALIHLHEDGTYQLVKLPDRASEVKDMIITWLVTPPF